MNDEVGTANNLTVTLNGTALCTGVDDDSAYATWVAAAPKMLPGDELVIYQGERVVRAAKRYIAG